MLVSLYSSDDINFLDASSHLYNRVGPSVGPSVSPSITLTSKTREINVFEQKIDKAGILGLLDASL